MTISKARPERLKTSFGAAKDITISWQGLIRQRVVLLLAFAVLLLLTAAGALTIGTVPLPWREMLPALFRTAPSGGEAGLAERVIWEIRLPRILMSVITGSALAGAGTVMQATLRNPLVSPYTLGLSAGASFGAALALVFGAKIFGPDFWRLGKIFIATAAFLCALLTVLIALALVKWRRASSGTILLAGVAMGYLFSALVSVLKYLAKADQLQDVVFWLMGGLWWADWTMVVISAPVVLVGLFILFFRSWDLNTLALGEDVARSLGVDTRRLIRLTLLLATLVASVVISFTGAIGFIGLIAPHVGRYLLGHDHRFLLPGATLLGAWLLLLADTTARTILSPAEIPVGVVTSFLGVPYFLYLLLKNPHRSWSI